MTVSAIAMAGLVLAGVVVFLVEVTNRLRLVRIGRPPCSARPRRAPATAPGDDGLKAKNAEERTRTVDIATVVARSLR